MHSTFRWRLFSIWGAATKGFTSYFRQFFHLHSSYKTATKYDLWRHLTKAARAKGRLPNGATVGDVMDGWTTKYGYPYLQVTRNYNTSVVTIRQAQFTLMPPDRMAQMNVTRESASWWVPVTYETKKSLREPGKLDKKPLWLAGTPSRTISLAPLERDDWLLFNINATGNVILSLAMLAIDRA